MKPEPPLHSSCGSFAREPQWVVSLPKGLGFASKGAEAKKWFFYSLPYSFLVPCLPAQTFQSLAPLYSSCFIAELWHQAKQIKYWTCELPKSALGPQVMNSARGYLGSVVFIFHPQHSLFSNELPLHRTMVPILCPQKTWVSLLSDVSGLRAPELLQGQKGKKQTRT